LVAKQTIVELQNYVVTKLTTKDAKIPSQ